MHYGYTPEARGRLIDQIENHTPAAWPNTIANNWSFSGAKKPLGSPMFDAIRGDWEGVGNVIAYMKRYPYIPSKQ